MEKFIEIWAITEMRNGFAIQEQFGHKVQVYAYGIQARDYYDYELRCALISLPDGRQAVLTEVYYEPIISEFGDGDYTPMGVLVDRINNDHRN